MAQRGVERWCIAAQEIYREFPGWWCRECTLREFWGLIVTKTCGQTLALPSEKTPSGERRREGNLWQRRYWEHCLRDEQDFINHCEYIHHNPVKHGLVESPTDWPYSTIHRYRA